MKRLLLGLVVATFVVSVGCGRIGFPIEVHTEPDTGGNPVDGGEQQPDDSGLPELDGNIVVPEGGLTDDAGGPVGAILCGGGPCMCDRSTECTCAAGRNCSIMCPEGGCTVICEVGSTCDLSCTTGDCNLNCAPGANCLACCPGGNCGQTCGDTSVCAMDCQDGIGCSVMCNAGADCQIRCADSAACNLTCHPAAMACTLSMCPLAMCPPCG